MEQKMNYIISRMIYERNFDIPEWTYEFVNPYVLMDLMKLERKGIIDRYLKEDKVREFFDRIYGKVRFTPSFLSYIITGQHYDYMLLLSGRWDFIRMRLSLENYKLIFLDILFKYGIKDDVFIPRMKNIIRWMHIPKIYIAHFSDAKIKYILLDEKPNDEKIKYQEYMNRLVKILDANKSIELTHYFILLGVPVFFNDGDYVDTYMYLSIVRSSNWKLPLDRSITKVKYNDRGGIMRLLVDICQHQNLEALVLLKEMYGESVEISDLKNILYMNKYQYNVRYLTDFQDIIKIFGHESNGLPMEVQYSFLLNGGDVRTMFVNDKLLPEATIIKTPAMTMNLISILSLEQIRYLLYNSVDFVQDIFGCTLNYSHLIKLLEVLFELPFNEEFYRVLNNPETDRVDYRVALVQKITSYLSWDYIYQKVPQAMLYHEPSLFYITRHIGETNISYIPAERILPYITNIIARSNYIKFNLYCDGHYISLDKIVGNKKELYKNIVTYKKFGYIGDLITDNPKDLLETICKYYTEE